MDRIEESTPAPLLELLRILFILLILSISTGALDGTDRAEVAWHRLAGLAL